MMFARKARSMPAMPMAANSAPIVVGIRQTNSATSVGTSVPRLRSDGSLKWSEASRSVWTWSSIFVPPAKYVVSTASVSLTNALASTGPLIGSGVTSWLPVAPNKLVQSYGGVVAALCTTLPSNSNIPLSWTASAAVTPHNMPATTSKPAIARRALPDRP